MEVGDRVEELDRLAGCLDRHDRLAERLGDQSAGIHLHMDDVALEGLEHAQRPDVRRGLAEHHVAGVAEDPGDQVDRLLGPDRDDHVVGVGLDALEAHHVGDLFAQRGIALARAVLQRHGSVGRDQVADRVTHDVEGQAGDVGHTSGQGDHLGPGGDREQGPDLGGCHALRAGGIPVDIAVEPGAAADDLVHDSTSMDHPRTHRSTWVEIRPAPGGVA